MNNPEQR